MRRGSGLVALNPRLIYYGERSSSTFRGNGVARRRRTDHDPGPNDDAPRVTSPTSFRRVGRNAAIYGIASVAARVVSVVMLPVYTRYLTPAQYGLISLLDITVEITSILFTAGIRSGMGRFYFKATELVDRQRVVFTTFVLELALSTAGTLLLVVAAPTIHHLVFAGEGTPGLIRLAALNFTLSTMTFVPATLLALDQRATTVTVVGLVKLAMQVALNIYFLAYRHLGVESILLSTGIANGVIAVFLIAWMLRRTGIRFSMAVVRDLRRFGVPYQVTTGAAFILAFGDRFVLERTAGAAVVGLYGLAYQFGFLLYQVSVGPFLAAWDPQRYQMMTMPREERDAHFATGFMYFNLLAITAAMGICVFARPALLVLTSPAYHSAASLVPIIVLAYLVQSWGDATKFGIDITEQTKLVTWASWIGAAVVVVLYVVLIPPYAGYGAAIATLVAFIVRFALLLYWSQKVWPVNYQWGRPILLFIVAVAVVLPATLVPMAQTWKQFAFSAGLTAIYAALVWIFVLDDTHRAGIRDALRTHAVGALLKGT